MKKIALLTVLASGIAVGLLYGLNSRPLETVPDGTVAEAGVKGFAFSNPEIISGKDAPKRIAPEVIKTAEELVAKAEEKPIEESLVALTKENVREVHCVQVGPFYEDVLPKLRAPLKKNGLIDRMVIESMPVRFSYSVFVGPYTTLDRAKSEAARLQKNGVPSPTIMQLGNRENVIKIREFNDMKEAEGWARDFVNRYEVKNVRLSRLNDSEKARIRVVFPNVDVRQAEALRIMAQRQKLPAYVCPIH